MAAPARALPAVTSIVRRPWWFGFTCLAACGPCSTDEGRPPTEDTPPAVASVAPAPPATDPPLAREAEPELAWRAIGARSDATWAHGALRGLIADLDGDGRAEVVLVDSGWIRAVERSGRELARSPVPGGVQVLAAADLAGDGRAAILAGWGSTPENRGAPARVTVHRLRGNDLVEETLAVPTTSRHQVASLAPPTPDAPEVLIAYFDSTYLVRSVFATKENTGWSLRDAGTLRMATSQARADVDGDGMPDLVVARVYGDDQGADGDAFVLRPDGTRVPIPTTRGARSLAVADTDGDGVAEVFLGDGWHKNYGKLARGLLTWSRWQNGAFVSEVIEDTPGQYTIEQILAADVDGDGQLEIVARGNAYVRVYKRTGDRWHGVTIASASRDVAAGELDGEPGTELLILGPRAEIVGMRGVTWLR